MSGWKKARRAVVVILCFASIPGLRAQTTPAGSDSGTAGAFDVIQQTVTLAGTTPVTYNLVVPPAIPPAPVAQLSPLPVDSGSSSKPEVYLVFSATVYNHQWTLLKWGGEFGNFTAVSNIDFNLYSGMGEVDTPGTVYPYYMALDNETDTLGDDRAAKAFAQAQPLLPATHSGYVIVSGSATAQGVSALNDLHTYYDANAQALQQASTKRQQQAAQQARQTPSPAPNPVINFWPIRSALYGVGQ